MLFPRDKAESQIHPAPTSDRTDAFTTTVNISLALHPPASPFTQSLARAVPGTPFLHHAGLQHGQVLL